MLYYLSTFSCSTHSVQGELELTTDEKIFTISIRGFGYCDRTLFNSRKEEFKYSPMILLYKLDFSQLETKLRYYGQDYQRNSSIALQENGIELRRDVWK